MTTNYLDNYYARLGVSKIASPDEIQRAYRRAARQFHPDTNKKTGANELFLLVQEAFDTLSDADRRREYDATLPDDIDAPPALMVNTLYSRSQVTPGEPNQVVYVLLDLMPALTEEERSQSKPPLNVCLVLDTSTSMNGERLGQVVKAANQFVQQLTAHDIVSVVAFNDRASLVIPAERGQDTKRLISRISTLQTSGGTEIYQGLSAALKEVQRNLRPTSINHIVLITDGRTYGDEDACLRLAGQAAEQGVPISAIGIGEEWNEDFVDRLAAKAGGSSIYADRATDIHKLLEKRLSSLDKIYANNVKLQYEPGVQSYLQYAFRLAPDLGPLEAESPLFLGSIPMESSLSVLLEFEIDARNMRNGELTLAEGELRLDVPSRAIPANTARFRLSRPVQEMAKPEAPPQTLVNAIGKLSLYRMQERARQDLADGDSTGAAKRMRMLATHLLSHGEKSLAKTVLLAAEEMKAGDGLSEKSGKQIKYGTRALIGLDGTQNRKRSKR
jgi:Ca-activated chloride channel family protein